MLACLRVYLCAPAEADMQDLHECIFMLAFYFCAITAYRNKMEEKEKKKDEEELELEEDEDDGTDEEEQDEEDCI